MNNQELKHYGIPGMRWGHRKKNDDSNRVGLFRRKKQQSEDYEDESNQANLSEDAKRFNELKKKPINELSNSEMLWVTQRMQLEQNYKSSANRENREKIEKAKQTIGDISFIAENVRKIAQTVDYFKGKGPKPETEDKDSSSVVEKIKEKYESKTEVSNTSDPQNFKPTKSDKKYGKENANAGPKPLKPSLKTKNYNNLRSGNKSAEFKSYYSKPRTTGQKVLIGRIKKKK